MEKSPFSRFLGISTTILDSSKLIDKSFKAQKIISFDSNKGSKVFNTVDNVTSDQFKSAYQNLFGSESKFASGISEYSKNAFYSIINPEKLGVSIIDKQV